jgi:hypothetical protein
MYRAAAAVVKPGRRPTSTPTCPQSLLILDNLLLLHAGLLIVLAARVSIGALRCGYFLWLSKAVKRGLTGLLCPALNAAVNYWWAP